MEFIKQILRRIVRPPSLHPSGKNYCLKISRVTYWLYGPDCDQLFEKALHGCSDVQRMRQRMAYRSLFGARTFG